MSERSKKLWWVCLAAIGAIAFAWVTRARLAQLVPVVAEADAELRGGQYYSLVDATGRQVFTTGLMLNVGDEFISEDNRVYRITAIEGLTARCSPVGMAEIPVGATVLAEAPAAGGKVGVYHTHSDESYEPSEGTDSLPGKGGVMRVGEALRAALQKKGVAVVHDTTPHDPHDAGAYQRSRRTAARLLQQGVSAVLDIHRDAGPAEAYRRDVAGERVAGGMIVIGKQNPKWPSNLEFSKQVKRVADQMYPGLIRGILTTRGNFNQDLSERLMLVEFGTEKNSREEAERGAALLADVIPRAVAGAGGAAAPAGPGARSAIWWILLVAGACLVGFWAISMGGWKEALSKLGSGGHNGSRGGTDDAH
ncbi:MAG: stage II sporulation protein P [Bacillota bacterium]